MARPNVTDIYAQLKADEGTGPMRNGQHMPYVDTTGNTTIGYGRNLSSRGISETEAGSLLLVDIASARSELPIWAQNQLGTSSPRFGVLINLVFNLGPTGLAKFTDFLGFVRAGKYKEAADALRDSLAYKQNTARYERLAVQMETNLWQ